MIAHQKNADTHHHQESGLRILGVVKSEDVRKELLRIFHDIPRVSSELIIGNFADIYDHQGVHSPENIISASKKANIILVEIDKGDHNITETIKSFRESCSGGHKRLIVIYKGLSDEDILDLLHSGVNDFLSLPLTVEQTKQSILRLVTNENKLSSKASSSKVITFVHAAGGVGATTLAVNSAVALNNTKKRRSSCLLDFDLQFGSTHSHLDLAGYSPFENMLDNPTSFDLSMFEGMMQTHSSGLPVLTSPEIPFPVEALNSDLISRMLQFSKQRFQYTVIDMPITVTEWTDSVLKNSDIIYAVLQLNVPHITQLKRWIRMLENEGLSDLPVKFVVNKYHPSGLFHHEHVTLEQANSSLGLTIHHTVPEDEELILTSLDQGIPATQLKPHSKFSNAINHLLEDIIITEQQTAQKTH